MTFKFKILLGETKLGLLEYEDYVVYWEETTHTFKVSLNTFYQNWNLIIS